VAHQIHAEKFRRFPQISRIHVFLRKSAGNTLYEKLWNKYSLIKPVSAMHENDISYLIRKGIFNVYNTLGPGLLESAYEAALSYELSELGLKVNTQKVLPMIYKEIKVDVGYRIDIEVESKVIIEIKSIEELANVHHMQLLTYLRLSGLKLGILVNFNTIDITKAIFRKVNDL
jgi:GxxExxY protein